MCGDVICQNNGTCVNGSCACRPQYTGRNCSIEICKCTVQTDTPLSVSCVVSELVQGYTSVDKSNRWSLACLLHSY